MNRIKLDAKWKQLHEVGGERCILQTFSGKYIYKYMDEIL